MGRIPEKNEKMQEREPPYWAGHGPANAEERLHASLAAGLRMALGNLNPPEELSSQQYDLAFKLGLQPGESVRKEVTGGRAPEEAIPPRGYPDTGSASSGEAAPEQVVAWVPDWQAALRRPLRKRRCHLCFE